MPTPISTIIAPNPAPTTSPAKVPRGKPSGFGGTASPDVPFGGGGDTGEEEVLVTGGGGGVELLGMEGKISGDGDGGVDIAGENLR